MTVTAKDLVAEARERVDTVSPETAHGKFILDVREPAELEADGAIADALHIPRGLLEFKADPSSEKAEAALTQVLQREDAVHVLCASGARATLAAATLTRLGYRACVIEGGIGAWKQAGLPLARP